MQYSSTIQDVREVFRKDDLQYETYVREHDVLSLMRLVVHMGYARIFVLSHEMKIPANDSLRSSPVLPAPLEKVAFSIETGI